MERMRLSIHSTNALIGMESRRASLDIHSPRGELSIQQPKAKMEIRQPLGDLVIDSSRAKDALAIGPHLRFMNNIYSQMDGVYLQALGKIVDEGKRMADITNPKNAFADLAKEAYHRENPIRYATSPSCMNVDIQYYPKKAEISVEPQKPIIEYTPHKPDIQYRPGDLRVYLRQQNSIRFEVSNYNLYA